MENLKPHLVPIIFFILLILAIIITLAFGIFRSEVSKKKTPTETDKTITWVLGILAIGIWIATIIMGIMIFIKSMREQQDYEDFWARQPKEAWDTGIPTVS